MIGRTSIVSGFGLVCLSSMAFAAPMGEPGLQDRQQAACYDDVQRLCADAIPDVERVTACMKSKRAQVSARCARFYRAR